MVYVIRSGLIYCDVQQRSTRGLEPLPWLKIRQERVRKLSAT